MKKVITIILAILGVLLLLISSIFKAKENNTISIIGGADGPTSIYLAGKVGWNSILGLIIGVLLVIILLILLKKRKR